jgi:hypothetical protein
MSQLQDHVQTHLKGLKNKVSTYELDNIISEDTSNIT